MELRHLRYFCAVAQAGGFGEASRQLNVSQSAISEQIKDLEEEIGGVLLNRSQRRARLTTHGKIFLDEAQKTLAAAEHAVEITRRSLRGEVGTLSVSFFLWGAGGFFPRLIREYRRLHPGIRLSLFEMHTTVQMDALLNGKIDIGFTRPLEAPFDRQLNSELIYQDPIVAVLPKGHPLANGPVEVSALSSERFVICDRNMTPTLFDSIVGICSAAGFSPHIVNTSAMWSGVLTLVESGEGIALVPSGVRHLRTRGVVFCTLKPHTTTVGLVMAWKPDNVGSIQRDFLELVRESKDGIQKSNGG